MRLLPTLAAVLILAARVAHADIYTITFSGAGINDLPDPIPYSDSFTFDSSIHMSHPGDNAFIAPCYAPDCFSTPFYPNDGSGAPRDFVRNEGIINYNGDLFGTEEILYFSSNSNFTGPVISPFTGSTDNPIIPTGTFYAGVTFPYESYQARGTATIVDDTLNSAVPEPSTLALLGTGALGLVGSLRRRLLA